VEKDDKIFVNYTWHKGPLGLEIDAQGENDQAEEGVMLLKTPGPPFPTAVTAGMIVKDVNFIPGSDKSLVQVLSMIQELGYPLTMRFHTDVTAQKKFQPYKNEAISVFKLLTHLDGRRADFLRKKDLKNVCDAGHLKFDEMDPSGDGKVGQDEWLLHLAMQTAKKGSPRGEVWLQRLLDAIQNPDSFMFYEARARQVCVCYGSLAGVLYLYHNTPFVVLFVVMTFMCKNVRCLPW